MAQAWRILAAVSLAVIAGGCSTPPRGEPFQPEIVDPSRAVLYVFRDAQAGLRRRPIQVFINQEPAGTLLPGQYLSRTVPAAEVLVRVEGDASAARPVRLQPGDAAYMQVRTPALGSTRPTLELLETESARRVLATTTRASP